MPAKATSQLGLPRAMIHMENNLSLSAALDVSDFLMDVCGALPESPYTEDLLGQGKKQEVYWDRRAAFLRTRIEVKKHRHDLWRSS